MTTNDPLVDQLVFHEGSNIIGGRHIGYPCPKKKWTVGYGRNLEDKGLSEAEARMLLRNDIADAKEDMMYCLGKYEIALWTLNKPRQAVLIDMAFCHGRGRLIRYKKMFGAIKIEDWDTAAHELTDSKFGRDDVRRSSGLAKQLREGRYVQWRKCV